MVCGNTLPCRTHGSDRIKIGACVQIAHQPDRDRGYLKETHKMRQAGDTLKGVAIAEHDSHGHGLCYEVKFASGAVITYDREELEVVS
jgi:hypothetical protein